MADTPSSVEQALLNALALGETTQSLQRTLPEHAETIGALVQSLGGKYTEGDLARLEHLCERLGLLTAEKDKLVREQRFEEAVAARDKLQKEYKQCKGLPSLSAGLYTEQDRAQRIERLASELDATFVADLADSGLTLLIDPGTATPEAVAELLSEFSTLFRLIGGSGIDFRPMYVRQPEAVL